MCQIRWMRWAGLLMIISVQGCRQEAAVTRLQPVHVHQGKSGSDDFAASKAGSPRVVAGIELCWCPPGQFIMGSPPAEPWRHSDEAQVTVRLTQGFWMGKYAVTQGEWKRLQGKLPGLLTAAG